MRLNLKKPLAFIDLETTGVNVIQDRIVEISILKVNVDNNITTKTIKINPEKPISEEASMIHGIYDQDVKDLPTFKTIANQILNFLDGCDLAGYNSNKFDIPVLMEEFIRAGIKFSLHNRKLVDVQNIFHKMEKRTLSAAYKFYCNKNLDNAHSASADAQATYEVLLSQIKHYENCEIEQDNTKIKPIQNDISLLHEFSKHKECVDLVGCIVLDKTGRQVFNFGKYKGLAVEKVFNTDPNYYRWMMDGNFTLYTKQIITQIYMNCKNKGLFGQANKVLLNKN
ncbi:MAG: exonuclease domain-containing protein [Solitalea-like symbiont of Acarus siro]